MTGPWFVTWVGADPDTGERGVTVDQTDTHGEADRWAHEWADQHGGVATVHKPCGAIVAAYTSTPKEPPARG